MGPRPPQLHLSFEVDIARGWAAGGPTPHVPDPANTRAKGQTLHVHTEMGGDTTVPSPQFRWAQGALQGEI